MHNEMIFNGPSPMEGPVLKRPRLSLACNTCRLRKVKCDADYPQCRNCRIRNQVCETSDPRKPNEPVIRQWIETPEKAPKVAARPAGRDGSQAHSSPGQPQEQTAPSPDRTHDERTVHQPVDAGISPVHQQLDPLFNTDHGTNRTKIVGGSSSQGLMRSLDVYFKAARLKPVSGFFLHGMKHAEEMPIVLGISLPQLPGLQVRERYLSTFLRRIQPLYPVFNIEVLKDTISQLSSIGDLKDVSSEQIPSLVSVYLIMALAANEEHHSVTTEGEQYLQAAASLLGHIILVPYLPTIQALLMFTIVYRSRNSEGLGWQTLGMAIRIAYTLGIHRHTIIPSSEKNGCHPTPSRLLEARIWAICYSLERTMQLECGRPTVIIEPIDCDQILPLDSQTENNLLRWHLGLADYQGQISQHIYGHATKGRTARQIFEDTARLDQELLSWANTIPPEIRPGNDLFCSRDIYHIAAFLSIMYHNTMIALHRAALIAPNASFEAEVEGQCPDSPSRFRIRGGESICVNSARSVAKLTIELSDQGMDTRLLPAGELLLACIVLAIYLMKHPESALHATDLQLLKACLGLCGDQFAKCNMDARFVQGISLIYERTSAHLTSVQSSSKRFKTNKVSTSNAATEHVSHDIQPTPRDNNPPLSSLGPNHVDETTDSMQRGHAPFDLSIPMAMTQDRSNVSSLRQTLTGDTQQVASNKQHGFMFDSMVVNGTPHAPLSDEQSPFQPDDIQFPFEGYNVENLWNWMLAFDPEDLGSTPSMLV